MTVVPRPAATPSSEVDHSITSVVIIGNGIAGLTAAQHVRRLHSRCAIHVVSREPHHVYNRVALNRLVTRHVGLTDVGVLPQEWFAEHRITAHLGTEVIGLDVTTHEVTLDTSERLTYDRLILAMGAAPVHLAIPGLHLDGVHVIRTAEQVLAARTEADGHPELRTGVVLGEGPLGVHAAIALTGLGLFVRLIGGEPWPLRDLVDERAGELIQAQLATLGAHFELDVAASRIYGDDRVTGVGLSDGRQIPCDVLLVCAGSRPEVDLALAAGLQVRRGVVVDDTMRTTDPHVFAAGGVAEQPLGVNDPTHAVLEQAIVAAEQAVARRSSDARRYRTGPPVTQLDVPGLQVVSIGRTRPQPSDHAVIVLDDRTRRRYRKVIVACEGTVAGGIVVNDPRAAAAIESVTVHNVDVRPHLPKLRRGDFAALQPATRRMTGNRQTAWVMATAVLCAVIGGSAAVLSVGRAGRADSAESRLVLTVGILVLVAVVVLAIAQLMSRRDRFRDSSPKVGAPRPDTVPGGATVPDEMRGSEVRPSPEREVAQDEGRSEAATAEQATSPAGERPKIAFESEEVPASSGPTSRGRTVKSQAASAAAAVAAAEQQARAVAAAARLAAEAASSSRTRRGTRSGRRPSGDAVERDSSD
jgi:NADPH-dependent 2,4-dienoyl-CoA reductase/sulfur reductase-like enzyme